MIVRVSRPAAALLLALVTAFSGMRAGSAAGLDRLFELLREAPDSLSAQIVEQQIWQAWLSPGDAEADTLLKQGMQAMDRGEFGEAVTVFSHLIELRPGYAEGWNKRATAYYLMREMQNSVADIERTLALEPRHFGALSGMGLIFLAREDLHGALGAFRQVLKIHPRSPSANYHVEQIEKLLQGRAV